MTCQEGLPFSHIKIGCFFLLILACYFHYENNLKMCYGNKYNFSDCLELGRKHLRNPFSSLFLIHQARLRGMETDCAVFTHVTLAWCLRNAITNNHFCRLRDSLHNLQEGFQLCDLVIWPVLNLGILHLTCNLAFVTQKSWHLAKAS